MNYCDTLTCCDYAIEGTSFCAAHSRASDPVWASQSLRKKCECEMCRQGVATSHNDESHDQSLRQVLTLWQPDKGAYNVTVIGGTTKCARVLSQFLAERESRILAAPASSSSSSGSSSSSSSSSASSSSSSSSVLCNFDFASNELLAGRLVLEVGAGTGLVSMQMALLGARVVATDMEPLMDTLLFNMEANITDQKVVCRPLLWDEAAQSQVFGADLQGWSDADKVVLVSDVGQDVQVSVVVGSDLIYAKETIPDLVATYESLCYNKGSTGLLAVIRRFQWEEEFFELMKKQFVQNLIHKKEDIDIYQFVRR